MALYSGDIVITNNFQLASGKPYFSNMWADDISDLTGMSATLRWEGMFVFVINEDKWYYLKSDLTTWKPLGSGSAVSKILTSKMFT